MSILIRDAGISVRVCFAVTALRIRVSMSAIGSVISQLSIASARVSWRAPAARTNSPTALGHPGNVAFERQLAEAEAAQRKLPHVGARPAAQGAAVAQANLEFRGLLFFRDLCCCSHVLPSSHPPCPRTIQSRREPAATAGTACR